YIYCVNLGSLKGTMAELKTGLPFSSYVFLSQLFTSQGISHRFLFWKDLSKFALPFTDRPFTQGTLISNLKLLFRVYILLLSFPAASVLIVIGLLPSIISGPGDPSGHFACTFGLPKVVVLKIVPYPLVGDLRFSILP